MVGMSFKFENTQKKILFNGKGNFRDYVQLEKNPFHPFSTTIQLQLKFLVGIFETFEFEALTVMRIMLSQLLMKNL